MCLLSSDLLLADRVPDFDSSSCNLLVFHVIVTDFVHKHGCHIVDLVEVCFHELVVDLHNIHKSLESVSLNFTMLYPCKIKNALHDFVSAVLILKHLIRVSRESVDGLGNNLCKLDIWWIDIVDHGVPDREVFIYRELRGFSVVHDKA